MAEKSEPEKPKTDPPPKKERFSNPDKPLIPVKHKPEKS